MSEDQKSCTQSTEERVAIVSKVIASHGGTHLIADEARAILEALDSVPSSTPQLEAWQFQPDRDCPGIYLLCSTAAQREAVMRALGWTTQKQYEHEHAKSVAFQEAGMEDKTDAE